MSHNSYATKRNESRGGISLTRWEKIAMVVKKVDYEEG